MIKRLRLRRFSKRPTRAQRNWAQTFDIPKDQACTVNVNKCRRYMDWLKHPLVKLERFLDSMEVRRRSDTSKEFE